VVFVLTGVLHKLHVNHLQHLNDVLQRFVLVEALVLLCVLTLLNFLFDFLDDLAFVEVFIHQFLRFFFIPLNLYLNLLELIFLLGAVVHDPRVRADSAVDSLAPLVAVDIEFLGQGVDATPVPVLFKHEFVDFRPPF